MKGTHLGEVLQSAREDQHVGRAMRLARVCTVLVYVILVRRVQVQQLRVRHIQIDFVREVEGYGKDRIKAMKPTRQRS